MTGSVVGRRDGVAHSYGDIMAFAMLYQAGDTLTVPALGYATDTEIDGLYRLLFSAIHEHTQPHALLLNYSSGAGDFKRKRGGRAAVGIHDGLCAVETSEWLARKAFALARKKNTGY